MQKADYLKHYSLKGLAMAFKYSALFAVFAPGGEVKMLIDKLHVHGFLNSNIKIVYPTNSAQPDIERLQVTMILYFSKIGAYIGLITFFIIGLVIVSGWLHPGPYINVGFLNETYIVLFTTFFGLIFGAASGALIGIGTPQSAVLRFANYLKAGATLVSVQITNSDEEAAVKSSFKACGARDIIKLNEKATWNSIQLALLENVKFY